MDNRINILSISGGKDSTALYLHALEQGVEFQAVFADTGNEHEATYEYVRELPRRTGGPEVKWAKAVFSERIARKRERIVAEWPAHLACRALPILHPSGIPFIDLCMWKGRFPGAKSRFCTSELKIVPLFEQAIEPALQTGAEVWSWQGVRRDESRTRASVLELEHRGGNLWNYRPLADWTVGDVFAIHKRHGLPPNPLYKQGMARVGCMPCVMSRKGEIHMIAQRFPDHIEKVRIWENALRVVGKRNDHSFFPAGTIPGTKDSRSHIDAVVSWAATARGGRQFDLLKTLPLPRCASEYGLCE